MCKINYFSLSSLAFELYLTSEAGNIGHTVLIDVVVVVVHPAPDVLPVVFKRWGNYGEAVLRQ